MGWNGGERCDSAHAKQQQTADTHVYGKKPDGLAGAGQLESALTHEASGDLKNTPLHAVGAPPLPPAQGPLPPPARFASAALPPPLASAHETPTGASADA